MKKYSVSFINTENQEILKVQGEKWIHSNETFIVDSSKSIKITGEFGSVGKLDSKVYFGLAPITNKSIKVHNWGEKNIHSSFETNFLSSDHILRKTSDEFTVILTESKGFIVKEDATKINLTDLYDWEKSLFVFIDGNTSKHPDHVLIKRKENTPKSEDYGLIRRTSDRFISLNVDLDQTNLKNEIISGVTKIIQATSGGYWIYCCDKLSGGTISTENLEVYEGSVQGESEIGKYDPHKLPKFTNKVKVTIGFNYEQSDDAICLFDKIEIEGEGIQKECLFDKIEIEGKVIQEEKEILNERIISILIPENEKEL